MLFFDVHLKLDEGFLFHSTHVDSAECRFGRQNVYGMSLLCVWNVYAQSVFFLRQKSKGRRPSGKEHLFLRARRP